MYPELKYYKIKNKTTTKHILDTLFKYHLKKCDTYSHFYFFSKLLRGISSRKPCGTASSQCHGFIQTLSQP